MDKIIIFLSMILIIASSCSDDEDGNSNGMDYKEEMREFVIGISQWAKYENPDFLVIPQNGAELITLNGEEDGPPHAEYLNSIDGNGQEDLFYGYDNDDEPTPANEREYLQSFLDISKDHGNIILVTDYCSTSSRMDDSYAQNHSNGYISFAADHRELDHIPGYPDHPYQENHEQVNTLSGVKNFLYLINPEQYQSRLEFIQAVTSSNYDLVIMDLFFQDGTAFTAEEIDQLRSKANGGKRLVVCYMSIGEAENYRYYWNTAWYNEKPVWLDGENPDWEGNYKVKYWTQEWQDIIYGPDDSYLQIIMDAHFDGVYLDIIDAFEYFE